MTGRGSERERAADALHPSAVRERRQTHGSGLANTRIADREDAYKARHRTIMLSPDRGGDAFSGQTPARSYAEIMKGEPGGPAPSELLRGRS